MYESDYKISVKGLTSDKQCFIISTVVGSVVGFGKDYFFLYCFTPFILAEQHREIGAVLLYT